MKPICSSVLDAIGNTPLIRLDKLCDDSMATVLGKAEFMNPGGAIKDRMAVYMVNQAEQEGRLKPGGTIVENTSGNTGFALAMVAAVRGYRSIFTIPDKMSLEKINMMKGMGAEVHVTPTDVAHDAPENYCETAKRIAQETENSFYVDQYNQPANIDAHYQTTGPEIWRDTEGKIDCFVAAAGTGGTITGVGRYLKEQAASHGKEVKIVCPDPEGSIFCDLFYQREPKEPRMYKVEGIGNDFLVGCLDFSVIDEMFTVSDRDAFLTARRLAREEGIFCGGSAGLNVFAALKVARELGPGKTVVTVLCDSGQRYISKQFNDEWLKDLGFLNLDERLGIVRELLQFQQCQVHFAEAGETIDAVARRMNSLGVSQMPIVGKELMIHEADLLKGLVSGLCQASDSVEKVATPLEGKVTLEDPVSCLEDIFAKDEVAVVMGNSGVEGIITKIDLVRYLTLKTK